ncbi:MAG TPA: Mu-like prophage major head subunit gpT family protein [Polyangia bacterium]|nr:Mu-like prophage major head subunit gpT family protein [Polyangia bacterium]
MGSPLTPALLQAFFNQADMRYNRAYKRRKVFWNLFAELCPSGTEANIYNWLAEMPDLRPWVGEKVLNNLKARAYPLTNADWEHTYTFDRNKIEDDQAGIYMSQADLQGDAAARWPDRMVTNALFAATTAVGFDGNPFFYNSHPIDIDNPGLGTYSNLLTSSPLNQANYAAAKAAMRSFEGESGIPLEVSPTLLMVPPALEQIGKEIINAATIVRTVQNVAATENVAAAGVSNVFQGDLTLVVNERLAADPTQNAWYLFSTDRIKPFIFQQRKAPTRIPITDPTNPLVFNQRKFAYSVEARGAAGVSLPFLAIKCTP